MHAEISETLAAAYDDVVGNERGDMGEAIVSALAEHMNEKTFSGEAAQAELSLLADVVLSAGRSLPANAEDFRKNLTAAFGRRVGSKPDATTDALLETVVLHLVRNDPDLLYVQHETAMVSEVLRTAGYRLMDAASPSGPAMLH
jgi:hypothetical protein